MLYQLLSSVDLGKFPMKKIFYRAIDDRCVTAGIKESFCVYRFVCSDCGRGFKWRHALQAHSYTHSPSTRLLCDICGFSSKYVTSFKAHLVQHSGRSFPCPHPGCAFSSTRKTHLNDHLATHTKVRQAGLGLYLINAVMRMLSYQQSWHRYITISIWILSYWYQHTNMSVSGTAYVWGIAIL